jgi:hypothetical protein
MAKSLKIWNPCGWVSGILSDNVIHYCYDPNVGGDLNAIEDIERGGLIILDENEDEGWIEAISADDLRKTN